MHPNALKLETGTDELLAEIRDRVATITLNRPAARNSLSNELTPALRRMIRQCGDDPGVGAILITGAAPAVCAGGNGKGMGAGTEKVTSLEAGVTELSIRQRTLTVALVALGKPRMVRGVIRAAGARM